jgi:uncharacterized membrane protein (UPF0127 family)
MKKIAWPWIGTTEHEMGSDSAKGEFTDKEEGSHERPDGLAVNKSVLEDADPITEFSNGIMSPVEGVSFADDEETKSDKASVEISDDEGLIANFSCNVAKDIQDKIAGLQPYRGLQESAGLIFPYRRAEDVIYHMGSVSFPIDIIFVDSDDKIKKIYKNIKPGTLGTFGCASVKNVLEICGGLSDRLGIDVGKHVSISPGKDSELPSVAHLNKISSQIGIKKDVIIQYSNVFRSGFHNWNGYPVLAISDNLDKTASDNKLISDLVKNFTNIDSREIYAFDFDGLIEESPMVRVYKTSEVVEDEIPYIRIDGHTVSINKTETGNEVYRDVHLHELMREGVEKGESILASLNKSFAYFLPDNEILSDASKIFDEVRHAAADSDSRVIIVTRSPNPDYLRAMITTRLNLQFGEPIDMDVVKVAEDADVDDIAKTLKKVCGNYDMKIFSDKSLLKRAGTPVPDEVKNRAKKVYKLLDTATEHSKKSLDNMKRNLAEYDKIKTDTDAIVRSKGQYNQSVRNNTRVVRGYLIKIRDAIKIFNEIKDISTTMEIIDGLASSAKSASDSVEEIFDLIDQIDSPDFHMLLAEKVGEYEKMIEDLHSSIERGMEYINSDILGLVILSD